MHEWDAGSTETIMNGCRVPYRLYRTVNGVHGSRGGARRRAAAGITRGPPLTSSRTSEASSEAAPYRRSDHEFG